MMGAKEMLLVDDVDNKEFFNLAYQFNVYDELPAPKPDNRIRGLKMLETKETND